MHNSRSALASQREFVARAGASVLRIAADPSSRWIQLGVYPGGHDAVAAAWQRSVGGELPTSARTVAPAAGGRVYRIAQDQYLLRDVADAQAAALLSALPEDAAGWTDLTGSRVAIRITGSAARDVLSQCVTIDLHPTVFVEGAFAQTGIHHVGGLLERNGPDDYGYIALRTYALTVWEALTDAAQRAA